MRGPAGATVPVKAYPGDLRYDRVGLVATAVASFDASQAAALPALSYCDGVGLAFFVLGGFGPLVAAATMTRILGDLLTDSFKGSFAGGWRPAGTSSQSAYRSS